MSNSPNFFDSVKAGWGKVSPVFEAIGNVIRWICTWIYKLRKIAMAVPVVIAALKLASDNLARLPETVGLNIQSTGEYAISVTRNYAVWGPFGVTIFCLLLMFCSRKATYPWIISVFSLVLPFLIYLTNIYPA